jgi:hypothetical protein
MSTTIEINRVPSPNAGHHFQAKELHRKTSGKLLVKTELVTISNDYEVTSLPLSMCTNQQSAPEVTPDPTANLTFDLTLSEREKEERGRLVLPYHHSHQKKTALLQVHQTGHTDHTQHHSPSPCLPCPGWLWSDTLPA